MPMRVVRHVAEHPVRLVLTAMVAMLLALASAGTALLFVVTANRSAAENACLQVNELRRELYIAAADLGISPVIRARFLPTKNCEG